MSEEQEVTLPTPAELLGEGQETIQEEKAPELTEHEKRAIEKGWVPKDQWTGEPESWRPAKDYLDRGELIGKIMAQGRQLEELRQAVVFLSEKEKKQFAAGYERAIEETKAQRNALLQEGDVYEAAQLDDKLDLLKEQAREAKAAMKAPPPGPSQTFLSWAEKNTWYNGQNELSQKADEIGVNFKKKNPYSSEEEMLEYVEREVKKSNPQKFGVPVKAAPGPDGDGRSPRNNPSGKTSYSNIEANMSELEKTIMRTMMKSAGMTKEQYLKDYSESN